MTQGPYPAPPGQGQDVRPVSVCGGVVREGKWLWLVALHVAGWGMANSIGEAVQGPRESGGTNSRQAPVLAVPPRTQGPSISLPPN